MRDRIIEVMARASCKRTCGTKRFMPKCKCIGWRAYKADMEAALTALQAEGMTVVPVEPTPAMLAAVRWDDDDARDGWQCMIDAAHTQEKDA